MSDTDNIPAYSPTTDTHYKNWDALVKAESNGYVVVGTSDRHDTSAIVIGPYATKEEAQQARARLRPKWVREERPNKITTSIRILWKEKP